LTKARRHISFALWTAALPARASPARADRLPVRIYTSAEGLGSSFVNGLMRDSHGFLWLRARDGLRRFDGLGSQMLGFPHQA